MRTGKAYKGIGMEGAIAAWYAKNTGRDQTRFRDTARQIAERTPSGARILEVAPGPGYLAVELARRGYDVTAVDISRTFVQIARENAARAGVHIDVRHGNASELPLPDDSFDAVVCVAAFKNFADPVGAINEMHRVLKPGGVASIFDLRKDASPEEIAAEVRNMHLSPLNARITRWTFQLMLIKRAYAPDVLARMAADSRFSGGDLLPSGIGCEVRLVKRSLAPLRARLQDHARA